MNLCFIFVIFLFKGLANIDRNSTQIHLDISFTADLIEQSDFTHYT